MKPRLSAWPRETFEKVNDITEEEWSSEDEIETFIPELPALNDLVNEILLRNSIARQTVESVN